MRQNYIFRKRKIHLEFDYFDMFLQCKLGQFGLSNIKNLKQIICFYFFVHIKIGLEKKLTGLRNLSCLIMFCLYSTIFFSLVFARIKLGLK